MDDEITKLVESVKLLPGNIAIYRYTSNTLQSVYHSDGIATLYGYSQEEYRNVERDNAFDLIFEPDKKRVMDELSHLVQCQEQITVMYRVKHKVTGYAWIQAEVAFIKTNEMNPYLLFNIANLVKGSETIGLLMNASERITFVIDKETRELLFVNKAFLTLSQKERLECLGDYCNKIICKQDCISENKCFCFHLINQVGKQFYHNEKTDQYFEIEAKKICWIGKDAYAFFIDDVTEKTKKEQLERQQREEIYAKSRENENRLNKMILFANLLVYDYDPSAKKFINDNGWIKAYGLSEFLNQIPESMIKSSIIEKQSIVPFRELFSEIDMGKDDISRVIWLQLPPDARRVCLRISSHVVKDEKGNPILVHGIGQDITEQRNAEDAYEHRVNSIFRMNPDAVSTFLANITMNWCGKGKSIYKNIEQLQKKGTVDGFVEDAMFFIKDKREQKAFAKTFNRKGLIEQFNRGNIHIDLDHHYLLEEGRDEWVRSSLELIKNPVSGDIEAVFYTINIHRHVVLDNMFRNVAEREYDLISGIYLKSDEYLIMDYRNNYLLEKKNNYENHQKKRMMSVICDNEEKEQILQQFEWSHILAQVKEKGEFILTFCTMDENHKKHRKKLRYSYIDKEREIILMTCRDITDLYMNELHQEKALQKALLRAEDASKAKSEFLTRISHDLRTPLNGIIGMLQLAKMESSMEKVQYDIDSATTSSHFLIGLINDILDMSKIEAGKVSLHSEAYNFHQFSEYLDVVIRPLCNQNNLEFVATAELPETTILVDTLRFNQIFFNLLSNSAKYTKPGGKVVFECKNYQKIEDKISIDFYVRDNGIGMSDEFQKHLFETFSQEERNILKGVQGTGLGLSITKSLVVLMGGSIEVSSKINEGTTFKVNLILPFVTEEKMEKITQKNKIEKSLDKIDFSNVNILLCEDNSLNQEIAVCLLERVGAKVKVANNGREGVNLFQASKEHEFDLILMDIRMPEMDGLSATREIRSLNREDAKSIPIIAMTANALTEEKEECLNAGMNAHIMKPIDVNEVYQMIDSFLAKE